MKNINKLALVAGEGELPAEIYEQCKKDNIHTVILRASEKDNFKLANEEYVLIDFANPTKTIEFLKINNFENLVFAGRVSYSALFENYQNIRENNSSILSSRGDNSYFSGIVHFVENMGFKVIGIHEILQNAVVEKGLLTSTTPTIEYQNDINLGFKIDKKISDLDIGQSLVIDNGYVLGIEAIEGTDNLLKRCKEFKTPKRSGVLIKIKKNNQEIRIDFPVIGEHTIEKIYECNLAGVALEAGSSIIINKKKTIELANKLGIFIIGI